MRHSEGWGGEDEGCFSLEVRSVGKHLLGRPRIWQDIIKNEHKEMSYEVGSWICFLRIVHISLR
jgi:hypothetical protein